MGVYVELIWLLVHLIACCRPKYCLYVVSSAYHTDQWHTEEQRTSHHKPKKDQGVKALLILHYYARPPSCKPHSPPLVSLSLSPSLSPSPSQPGTQPCSRVSRGGACHRNTSPRRSCCFVIHVSVASRRWPADGTGTPKTA